MKSLADYMFIGFVIFGLLCAVGSGGVALYVLINSSQNVASVIFGQMAFGAVVFLSTVGTSYFLIRRLKYESNNISTLTMIYLKSKISEFIVSTGILLLIGLYALWLEYDKIVLISIVLFGFTISTQILTVYRIFIGSFGYNAPEMKELVQYIGDRHLNDRIPPNMKGLRDHPALIGERPRVENFGGVRTR